TPCASPSPRPRMRTFVRGEGGGSGWGQRAKTPADLAPASPSLALPLLGREQVSGGGGATLPTLRSVVPARPRTRRPRPGQTTPARGPFLSGVSSAPCSRLF